MRDGLRGHQGGEGVEGSCLGSFFSKSVHV